MVVNFYLLFSIVRWRGLRKTRLPVFVGLEHHANRSEILHQEIVSWLPFIFPNAELKPQAGQFPPVAL